MNAVETLIYLLALVLFPLLWAALVIRIEHHPISRD